GHETVALLDLVTGDGIQCRSAQRLAGAETETGVMPRAPDGVVDDQSLGERPAVMATGRAEGAEIVTPGNEDDVVAADLAGERDAIDERFNRDTSGEVASTSGRGLTAHDEGLRSTILDAPIGGKIFLTGRVPVILSGRGEPLTAGWTSQVHSTQ